MAVPPECQAGRGQSLTRAYGSPIAKPIIIVGHVVVENEAVSGIPGVASAGQVAVRVGDQPVGCSKANAPPIESASGAVICIVYVLTFCPIHATIVAKIRELKS